MSETQPDVVLPSPFEGGVPLPWSRSCFVCGQDNPRGLQSRSFQVEDSVCLPFTPPRDLAGWNGVIHGGLIATVLDEVMTWVAILAAESPCYAADFQIRLVRPLGPGEACVATGRLAGNRRRILDTEADLRGSSGELFARASGRYMTVPQDQRGDLRDDFVTEPGCLDVVSWFHQGSRA